MEIGMMEGDLGGYEEGNGGRLGGREGEREDRRERDGATEDGKVAETVDD